LADNSILADDMTATLSALRSTVSPEESARNEAVEWLLSPP
jgi:hypothetical protein